MHKRLSQGFGPWVHDPEITKMWRRPPPQKDPKLLVFYVSGPKPSLEAALSDSFPLLGPEPRSNHDEPFRVQCTSKDPGSQSTGSLPKRRITKRKTKIQGGRGEDVGYMEKKYKVQRWSYTNKTLHRKKKQEIVVPAVAVGRTQQNTFHNQGYCTVKIRIIG